MNLLGKALCFTVLVLITTTAFAGPVSESQNQLLMPLNGQELVTGTTSHVTNLHPNATSTPFDGLESDSLDTNSAFIDEDSSENKRVFFEQSYDNQALIITGDR